MYIKYIDKPACPTCIRIQQETKELVEMLNLDQQSEPRPRQKQSLAEDSHRLIIAKNAELQKHWQDAHMKTWQMI